jgi:hypothetical protein
MAYIFHRLTLVIIKSTELITSMYSNRFELHVMRSPCLQALHLCLHVSQLRPFSPFPLALPTVLGGYLKPESLHEPRLVRTLLFSTNFLS